MRCLLNASQGAHRLCYATKQFKRFNSLIDSLEKQIKLFGPLTLKSYISQCLSHPTYGYYAKRGKVGGKDCDFITAPEVSAIFGILVGHFIKFEVESLFEHYNKKVKIVELGPGNGTLMKDVMHVIKSVADKVEGIHMVDSSALLAEKQCETVGGRFYCNESKKFVTVSQENVYKATFMTTSGINVNWLENIHLFDQVGPCIFLLNEYLDVLPVQLYSKNECREWSPISINYDEEKKKLVMVRRPLSSLNAYENLILNQYYRPYTWAEFSMDAFAQWRHILNILNTHGGTVLNIDYGYTEGERPPQFTLRSFKNHEVFSILEYPGDSDITCDVDFSTYERIAKTYANLKCYDILTQEEFLKEMGIDELAKKLNKTYSSIEQHTSSVVEYLTSPEKMGKRFKVQVITGKDQCEPICF